MTKGGKRRNYCPLKFNGLFPTSIQIKKQLHGTNKRNLSINAECTHATAKEYIIWRYSTRPRGRRILGTKLRKNERGNQYINSIWTTVYRLTCVVPNSAHFYRAAAWRSLPNEELLVYWNAPRTHKSNKLIDKTSPTVHGLINTNEFAKYMTFATAISYCWLLCKEPHNTAHTPISGCYMHHASKHL